MDWFWHSEGLRLDKEAIRYSAAKRGLAKLRLNSMWGKFTETNDRPMTKMITEQKNLYGFLATPGFELMNLAFASYDEIWISWKRRAEKDVRNLLHANEVIGTYVTAGATIHIYRYLDRLGENAMYCEKGSVIYIQPKGDVTH